MGWSPAPVVLDRAHRFARPLSPGKTERRRRLPMASSPTRRLRVRLGAFRSRLPGVGDADGARWLTEALRRAARVQVVASGPAIVLEGELSGGSPVGPLSARPSTGPVVCDLTARYAASGRPVDAQTARLAAQAPGAGESVDSAQAAAAQAAAARAAVDEAASQLLRRLLQDLAD